MTFLAPWYLLAAGAAAAAVVALHFLARVRPRRAPLPTARFVPEHLARAPARAVRPSDLPLLLIRVLAVLLAGAAFAQPVRPPERRPVARVVALDVSRGVHAPAAARDSAAAYLRDGDVLIVFDTVVRRVRGNSLDSVPAAERRPPAGSLSAALVAALQAAASLRTRADSVELVLVSPLVEEEWDAATSGIRSLWRGRARLVRIGASTATLQEPGIDLRASEDDPLRATLALMGVLRSDATVRVRRGVMTAADSQWVRSAARVLVHWPPASGDGRSPGKSRGDTVGAVMAGEAVVLAPFARMAPVREGRAVAWWVDGQAAAVEVPAGEGCVRNVSIPLEEAGDLALRESTRRLVRELTEPCGGEPSFSPLPDSAIHALRGEGPLLTTRAIPGAAPRSRLAAWLFAGAALLLLAEPLARRRGGES